VLSLWWIGASSWIWRLHRPEPMLRWLRSCFSLSLLHVSFQLRRATTDEGESGRKREEPGCPGRTSVSFLTELNCHRLAKVPRVSSNLNGDVSQQHFSMCTREKQSENKFYGVVNRCIIWYAECSLIRRRYSFRRIALMIFHFQICSSRLEKFHSSIRKSFHLGSWCCVSASFSSFCFLHASVFVLSGNYACCWSPPDVLSYSLRLTAEPTYSPERRWA
jgi:hypothetical protein